jgi:hypothetical protein
MFVLGAHSVRRAVADRGQGVERDPHRGSAPPPQHLDGNDIDAWDPDYIRRILPIWRASLRTYFRSEVRGLDNIPPTDRGIGVRRLGTDHDEICDEITDEMQDVLSDLQNERTVPVIG